DPVARPGTRPRDAHAAGELHAGDVSRVLDDRNGRNRRARAGARVHVQVLRRPGARDGCDAHLLPAGVLLQRERRVDLSRPRRAGAFGIVGWLVRRYGLRLAVPPPPADPHERRAFVIYGTLAFLYSITILILVAGAAFGWASRALGAVGVLAFALVLWGALRNKLQEWGRALVTSLREHRALWRSRRFWSRAGGAAVLVAVG